jgi:hypothetical protein
MLPTPIVQLPPPYQPATANAPGAMSGPQFSAVEALLPVADDVGALYSSPPPDGQWFQALETAEHGWTPTGWGARNAWFLATAAVDWSNGVHQRILLASGANAITFANPRDGEACWLALIQPASGAAATVTLPPGLRLVSGQTATLSSTNSERNLLIVIYDAAANFYLATMSGNFGA